MSVSYDGTVKFPEFLPFQCVHVWLFCSTQTHKIHAFAQSELPANKMVSWISADMPDSSAMSQRVLDSFDLADVVFYDALGPCNLQRSIVHPLHLQSFMEFLGGIRADGLQRL